MRISYTMGTREAGESNGYVIREPTGECSVNVYDDDDTNVFSKTYTSEKEARAVLEALVSLKAWLEKGMRRPVHHGPTELK